MQVDETFEHMKERLIKIMNKKEAESFEDPT